MIPTNKELLEQCIAKLSTEALVIRIGTHEQILKQETLIGTEVPHNDGAFHNGVSYFLKLYRADLQRRTANTTPLANR